MRLLPLAGVLAVAFWVTGGVIINAFTDLPANGSSPETQLAYFRDQPHRIFVAAYLFQLGSIVFVFFLGDLRTRLLAAEGRGGPLSAVAFAGGLGVAVFTFGILTGHMVAALDREALSPATADALAALSDLSFQGAKFFAIPLVTACALVALRSGVLPRAHVGASFALAVWLAIPHYGWMAILYAFPVWVAATSVLLARHRAIVPHVIATT
jgi:hypothetical protein